MSFDMFLGLISKKIPPSLGKTFPLNNNTKFYKKGKFPGCEITKSNSFSLAKGRMPLGIQIHQEIDILVFGLFQVYFFPQDLGCDFPLFYLLPFPKIHLYFNHHKNRYLNPVHNLLQSNLGHTLNLLLNCNKGLFNFL